MYIFQEQEGEAKQNSFPDYVLDYKYASLPVKDTYLRDRKKELQYKLPENFLAESQFLPSSRRKAMKWIMKRTKQTSVHSTHVFELAVAIFDRYISKRGHCNSIIISAALAYVLSTKMEEDMTFVTTKYCYEILNRKWPLERLIEKEREILQIMDYNLLIPLPCNFLARCNIILEDDPSRKLLSSFLVEAAIVSYEMCHLLPSLIAAAACCLSIAIMKQTSDLSSIWTQQLIDHTMYSFFDLKPILQNYCQLMITILEDPSESYVYQKYAQTEFKQISTCKELSGLFIKKVYFELKISENTEGASPLSLE